MKIIKVDTAHCVGGEGPLWDTTEQALYFIDNRGRKVHRYHPSSGETSSWSVPDVVTALALREQGGAVITLRSGIHFLDFSTGDVEPLSLSSAPPRHGFNDGKVDRYGRFIIGGSTSNIHEPIPDGGLLRLDPDHSLVRLDEGIHFSNGPCWSPDNSTFYFSDSLLHTVYAYDYDLSTGSAVNRRRFIDTTELGGVPDGATVDSEGRYWVAVYGAGKIVAYQPNGQIDQVIDMPVKLVSSLMFGGTDLDDLYVTTIERHYDDPDGPVEEGAGDLYVIKGLDVRGLPEPRYKG